MNKSNENSEFLQSEQWREFQQAVGRKTVHLQSEGFLANTVEHILPIVGKYFYCPRGPVLSAAAERISNFKFQISNGMQELVALAKNENAGWIRIDLENEEILELIKENISEKMVKAPHDMQPREVFIVDIEKSPEQLLSEMKTKTRYNIGIAQKKGVKIYSCDKKEMECMRAELEFVRLTKEMATRQGIVSHPEEYYRKMIESLPSDMLRIYVAEFDGKIIAANLVLFYGQTVTYLHGASGNEHRNLMAPFSLQWQAILDAKEKGFTRYDFGGVKTDPSDNSWAGITQFKVGFSPNTKPVEFSGSYDIVINTRKYAVYRGLQRAKSFAVKFRR